MSSSNYQEKLYTAVIDIATSGDNSIISAPGAAHYIAIDFLQVFTPNAVGVTFKHGSTAFNGKYAFASGQNITMENSFENRDGVLTCGMNESFSINLDASQQCSGFIRYRIIGE